MNKTVQEVYGYVERSEDSAQKMGQVSDTLLSQRMCNINQEEERREGVSKTVCDATAFLTPFQWFPGG